MLTISSAASSPAILVLAVKPLFRSLSKRRQRSTCTFANGMSLFVSVSSTAIPIATYADEFMSLFFFVESGFFLLFFFASSSSSSLTFFSSAIAVALPLIKLDIRSLITFFFVPSTPSVQPKCVATSLLISRIVTVSISAFVYISSTNASRSACSFCPFNLLDI